MPAETSGHPPPQRLNFLPLPHGHGSFRPTPRPPDIPPVFPRLAGRGFGLLDRFHDLRGQARDNHFAPEPAIISGGCHGSFSLLKVIVVGGSIDD